MFLCFINWLCVSIIDLVLFRYLRVLRSYVDIVCYNPSKKDHVDFSLLFFNVRGIRSSKRKALFLSTNKTQTSYSFKKPTIPILNGEVRCFSQSQMWGVSVCEGQFDLKSRRISFSGYLEGIKETLNANALIYMAAKKHFHTKKTRQLAKRVTLIKKR